MSDQRSPYAAPATTLAGAARRRFWPSRFFMATASALLGVIWLFLFEERRHFGDATNDPAIFRVALPYLVAVACISGVACAFSRQRRVGHAALLGLVLGPVVAFVAYNLYPLVHRWA